MARKRKSGKERIRELIWYMEKPSTAIGEKGRYKHVHSQQQLLRPPFSRTFFTADQKVFSLLIVLRRVLEMARKQSESAYLGPSKSVHYKTLPVGFFSVFEVSGVWCIRQLWL